MATLMSDDPKVDLERTQLTRLGASELASLIRSGEVSAREVTDAHIARIEVVNPGLNAVVFSMFDEARTAADAADRARAHGVALGALHGVPTTLKDQHLAQGTPTTLGLPSRREHRAVADGPCVARLRAAGAIFLGKTNVGQMLLSFESDNPLFGRTSNPWALDRSPGGSSGGEAAIVAAGGSALGLGADLGGSVRLPAHFCGVHGLKPTANRLSTLDTPEGIFCDQEAVPAQPGPIAREVRDLALAMSVLAAPGMDRLDPSVPAVPWREPNGVEGLRVGFYEDDGAFRPSPAIRRAVREAAEALEACGAEVRPWTPPDVSEAQRLFMVLAIPDRFAAFRRALRGNPVDPKLRGMLRSLSLPRQGAPLAAWFLGRAGQARMAWMAGEVGSTPSSGDAYAAAVGARAVYRRRFLAEMDAGGIDVLVCPPYGLPALTHGADAALRTFAGASYAQLYNALGMPAGVVSITRVQAGEESDRTPSRDGTERMASHVESGSAGLPIGVQVIARHWREDLVLATMAALEAAFRPRPDYPLAPPI